MYNIALKHNVRETVRVRQWQYILLERSVRMHLLNAGDTNQVVRWVRFLNPAPGVIFREPWESRLFWVLRRESGARARKMHEGSARVCLHVLLFSVCVCV